MDQPFNNKTTLFSHWLAAVKSHCQSTYHFGAAHHDSPKFKKCLAGVIRSIVWWWLRCCLEQEKNCSKKWPGHSEQTMELFWQIVDAPIHETSITPQNYFTLPTHAALYLKQQIKNIHTNTNPKSTQNKTKSLIKNIKTHLPNHINTTSLAQCNHTIHSPTRQKRLHKAPPNSNNCPTTLCKLSVIICEKQTHANLVRCPHAACFSL